ncbi:hypothetical protein H2201_000701 [Coniosporium apollinis]|uniref:Uncharacterized protein n=1 Tax=Coniosporium apollinis TaxID=61459 RepID=A0ABQ9P6Y1_9PEZI|nr:hypothetical protein H2201_000701 [Coniosporium apollinis]
MFNHRYISRFDPFKAPEIRSLLFVNRQISQEAHSILYETAPYCIQISEEMIQTPGRCVSTGDEADVGGKYEKYKRAELLSLPFARIRKLHICILASRFGAGRAFRDHDQEEVSLYNVRDNVQRLVSVLTDVPFIKELCVKLSLLAVEWSDEESVAAAKFLLNPFMRLRNISRPRLDNLQIGRVVRPGSLALYRVGSKISTTVYTPEIGFLDPLHNHGRPDPDEKLVDLSGIKGMRSGESNLASKASWLMYRDVEVAFVQHPIHEEYDPGDEGFAEYVGEWEKSLASDNPALPAPPLAQAYQDVKELLWKLEEAGVLRSDVFYVNADHWPGMRVPDLSMRMVLRARIAREANAAGDMAEIQQEIHALWTEFLAKSDGNRRKINECFARMAPLQSASQGLDALEVSQESIQERPVKEYPPRMPPPTCNAQGEPVVDIDMQEGDKPRARLVTPAVLDLLEAMQIDRDWWQGFISGQPNGQ